MVEAFQKCRLRLHGLAGETIYLILSKEPDCNSDQKKKTICDLWLLCNRIALQGFLISKNCLN